MYLFRYALYFKAFPHLRGAVINQLCSHFSPLFHRFYNNSFSDDRSPGRQFPPDARCLLRGGSVADSQAPPKTRFAWTVLRGPLLSSPPLRILPKHLPEAAGRDFCLLSRTKVHFFGFEIRQALPPSQKQKERTAQRLPAPVLNAVSDQSCTYGIRDT